jgi:hypothetical protein
MLSFAIMKCDGGDYEPGLYAQYFLCNCMIMSGQEML